MAVMTNIYRNEICTQAVFGNACGLPAQAPTGNTRARAGQFADEFFNANGRSSLSLEDFESYLEWVMTETSASTAATVELIAHNPESSDLVLVRLNSIAEAQWWVQEHISPPAPPSSQPGGGHRM
jgi:hypothetical protein